MPLNPTQIDNPVVEHLVNRVGLTDAHGPIFEPLPIYRALTPPAKERGKQNLETLGHLLRLVDAYVESGGQKEEAVPPRENVVSGFGWKPRVGWVPVHNIRHGFKDLYAMGFLAGVLIEEAPDNTFVYTIAKKSDLVPLPVGPAFATKEDQCCGRYCPQTILGVLALAELEANPAQNPASNWGGGSTIGGSPRNPGGRGSVIPPEALFEILRSRFG